MIKSKNNFLLNNKGITVTELVVGIGILTISLAIILSTHFSITQEMKKMDVIIQGKIETLSGEKSILFDIQEANISFNNLLIKDDNGAMFFDYIPEKPVNIFLKNPDRRITLSSTGTAQKEMVLLVQDNRKGSLLIYDPTAAYVIGESVTDFNVAASLSFISLNYNGRIVSQRPLFWTENQLLFLDTASRIRPTTTGLLNMNEAAVSPLFLGVVNGSALKPLALKDILIRNTHPESKQVISSVDYFLRTIPSFGGGVSTVRVQAAKIVKYYLSQSGSSTGLFKSVYNVATNSWEKGFLIADRIDNVIFQRQSTSSKIIQFKINKVQ